MKRITVTLTEDQARFLLTLLAETVLDSDGFQDEYTNDEIAFGKRIRSQFYKALNPYITES